MSRTKKIAVLAIIAMVLTMLPVQMFAATTQDTTGRLFGAGRVETALAVVDAGWDSADTVIVAAADQANLVDALAAAPLAGQEDAPILLTFKDSLDAAVKAKISELGASKAYVVGAVSDDVKAEIDAIDGVSAEALKGSSRWDTTKAINAKLTNPAGTFVVGYAALADALSVSAYAAAHNYAIVLADVNGNIPSGQSALGSTTYLVGGETLVSDIDGATRLSGADRFATNKDVLETLSFDYSKVYVANGFNNHLVDSLVAAPLAAKYNAAIVLADNSGVAASDYVNGQVSATSQVIALGGTGVVSDSVRDTVSYDTPAQFAVEDIVPLSLDSFKVTFNQAVDEDTAEAIASYRVDGSNAAGTGQAIMQSDEKSVVVILDQATTPFNQNQEVTIEVKSNAIYNKSKASTVGAYTEAVTFSDTTTPTVDSAKAVGNKQLRVYFSEPVELPGIANVRDWKLDGQKLSTIGLTTIETPNATTGGANLGLEVRMHFGSEIAAGAHTLTVAGGTANGQLSDSANFIFAEESKDVTIESVTGAPSVESVTAGEGTVYVTFDRAMYEDPQGLDASNPNSALNDSQYDINDKGAGQPSSLGGASKFKSGSGSKTVELSPATGVISEGVNVIEIDKDIKDAWGNKLSDGSDNIRASFNYAKDSTKPEVASVACLSSTVIRITFSEKVNGAYVRNGSNYTIKKSDGTTIGTGNYVADTVPAGETSADTVQITMNAGFELRGSDYSLKVKNIPDMALSSNIMDTYTTTFDGIDDLGPSVTEVIDNSNTHKASVVFDSALDSSTVILDNFGYLGGDGQSRALPSGSSVSIDSTGKIVTVSFPDAYTVDQGRSGATTKYSVWAIRVSNVEDKAGNVLQGIAVTQDIIANTGATVTPSYVTDSFVLKDNGSDVQATFDATQEITNLELTDFVVGASAGGNVLGVTPDSGYTTGKTVTLNFTNDTKVEVVRFNGKDTYLGTVANPTSTNTAGVPFAAIAAAGVQVYDDQVQPRIIDVDYIDDGGANYTDAIVVTFSEFVDTTVAGNIAEAFVFTDPAGATSVTVPVPAAYVDAGGGTYTNGNSAYVLVFDIADGVGAGSGYASGVNVKVDETKANQYIRDVKDRADDYNYLKVADSDVTGATYADDWAGAGTESAPALADFVFDMSQDGDEKYALIRATEPVEANTSLDKTAVGVSNASAAWGGAEVALANGTVAHIGPCTFMVNVITADDVSSIDQLADIGTAGSVFYMPINASAFEDLGGTANAAAAGKRVSVFTPDTRAVRIAAVASDGADNDLTNAEDLSITFSDYVKSNTGSGGVNIDAVVAYEVYNAAGVQQTSTTELAVHSGPGTADDQDAEISTNAGGSWANGWSLKFASSVKDIGGNGFSTLADQIVFNDVTDVATTAPVIQ